MRPENMRFNSNLYFPTRQFLYLCCCMLMFCPLPASAQEQTEFGTNDFQISDMGTAGNTNFKASSAAIAFNAAQNEYLVVWQADSDSGALVDDEFEIYGQRVDALTGSLVGDTSFRISEVGIDGDADRDASQPAIAFNNTAGEYLVIWIAASDLDDDDIEVYGRFLRANGTHKGEAFVISNMGNFDSMPATRDPAIVFNATENEYLVVWAGAKDTEDEFEVFGRRISATGNIIDADDVQISDMGPDGDDRFTVRFPALAVSSNTNQYLVAWAADTNENFQLDDEFEIFVQALDATDMSEVGEDDMRISDMGGIGSTAFQADRPSVTYDSTLGQYLVVWQGTDSAGSDTSQEIYGQFLLESDFSEVGTNDFQISDMGPANDTNYAASSPRVVYNSIEDEFLVVWQGDDDSLADDEFEIFSQRVAAGTTRAPTGVNDFRVSDAGTDGDSSSFAGFPGIAFNSDRNTYLVVWEADDPKGSVVDDEFEIFGQLIALRGTDLELTGSVSPDPVTARDFLTYSLTVTNNGPDNSGEIYVEGTVPDGMHLVSSTGDGWACYLTASVATCVLENLDVSESSTVMPVFSTAELITSPASISFSVIARDAVDLNSTNDAVTLEAEIEVACSGKRPKVRKSGDNAIVILPKRLITGLVENIRVRAVRISPRGARKQRRFTPRRRVRFKNLSSGIWRFTYVTTLRDASTCKSAARRVQF